jgi:hypothetical protein
LLAGCRAEPSPDPDRCCERTSRCGGPRHRRPAGVWTSHRSGIEPQHPWRRGPGHPLALAGLPPATSFLASSHRVSLARPRPVFSGCLRTGVRGPNDPRPAGARGRSGARVEGPRPRDSRRMRTLAADPPGPRAGWSRASPGAPSPPRCAAAARAPTARPRAAKLGSAVNRAVRSPIDSPRPPPAANRQPPGTARRQGRRRRRPSRAVRWLGRADAGVGERGPESRRRRSPTSCPPGTDREACCWSPPALGLGSPAGASRGPSRSPVGRVRRRLGEPAPGASAPRSVRLRAKSLCQNALGRSRASWATSFLVSPVRYRTRWAGYASTVRL